MFVVVISLYALTSFCCCLLYIYIFLLQQQQRRQQQQQRREKLLFFFYFWFCPLVSFWSVCLSRSVLFDTPVSLVILCPFFVFGFFFIDSDDCLIFCYCCYNSLNHCKFLSRMWETNILQHQIFLTFLLRVQFFMWAHNIIFDSCHYTNVCDRVAFIRISRTAECTRKK